MGEFEKSQGYSSPCCSGGGGESRFENLGFVRGGKLMGRGKGGGGGGGDDQILLKRSLSLA